MFFHNEHITSHSFPLLFSVIARFQYGMSIFSTSSPPQKKTDIAHSMGPQLFSLSIHKDISIPLKKLVLIGWVFCTLTSLIGKFVGKHYQEKAI